MALLANGLVMRGSTGEQRTLAAAWFEEMRTWTRAELDEAAAWARCLAARPRPSPAAGFCDRRGLDAMPACLARLPARIGVAPLAPGEEVALVALPETVVERSGGEWRILRSGALARGHVVGQRERPDQVLVRLKDGTEVKTHPWAWRRR